MDDHVVIAIAEEAAERVAAEKTAEVASPIAKRTAEAVAAEVAAPIALKTATDVAKGVARDVAATVATGRVSSEVAGYLTANPPKQGDKGDDGRSVKGDAGPGINWRGPFVKGTVYQTDDAVSFEGSSYIASRPTKATPPGGPWELMARKGKDGKDANSPMWFGGGGGSGGSGSALTVKDEGVSLDTAVDSIDFAGAGVTATAVGHAITVTIPAGGGGAPSGPAGGVLSGTYPDPGFAVDMATQAELDAAVAGLTTNVYVQPTDPGAVGAGKLWVDTTTPGPPWHVQIRDAADAAWNDVLEQYLASAGISIKSGPLQPVLIKADDAGGVTPGGALSLANGSGANDGGGAQLTSGGSADGQQGATLALTPGTSAMSGGVSVAAGGAGVGIAGGDASLVAGDGNDGDDLAAYVVVHGGNGIGNHGKLQVQTEASTGNSGEFLGSDGAGNTVWATPAGGGAPSYLSVAKWA